MVEYIQNQGCQVEVITFGRSASSRLRETVDDFIDMDERPHEFLIGYKQGRKNQSSKTPLRRHLKRIIEKDSE